MPHETWVRIRAAIFCYTILWCPTLQAPWYTHTLWYNHTPFYQFNNVYLCCNCWVSKYWRFNLWFQVPPPPPRESSMTPVPPSSPQCYQYYQYNYPSMPPSQQQRHMSPHRSCNGSVPPSPALSGVGCRSPSRQRKNTYSTLEVSHYLYLSLSAHCRIL